MADPASPLTALGLSEREAAVYQAVLTRPGTGARRVAEALRIDRPALDAAVGRLVADGLVEYAGEALRATPPEVAVGRLVAAETARIERERQGLEELRALVPKLRALHQRAHKVSGEPVVAETVVGGDAIALVRSLAAESEGELLWLRPDHWRLDVAPQLDDLVAELVRHGRPSRAIYPALALAEAPEMVRRRARSGERIRVTATVPLRMAVFGDQIALIQERLGVDNGRRLVIRSNAVVEALRLLFDALWERSRAVPGLDGWVIGVEQGGHRLLLDQLASGAIDEQIARALGVSLRTVRRRVAEVLAELGAESRFQAGVEAVRRGWL